MRYYQYITEKKWLKGTMIGFGVSPSDLNRVSKYIESWLIKHKIKYEKEKRPHFTIAQIPEKYPKDDLVRELSKFDLNMKFKPVDLTVFYGTNVKKDFVVIEYKPNMKFLQYFNDIDDKFEIRKFATIKPHVSLFILEQGGMTGDLLNDIKFSLPKLPVLKPTEIELWNNKFEIETRLK